MRGSVSRSVPLLVSLVEIWLCLLAWLQLQSTTTYGMRSSEISDTILQGQTIIHPNTIISPGGKFELGFFSPRHDDDDDETSYSNSNSNRYYYYLGIWHTFDKDSIVWVANREYPLRGGSNSSPNLTINSEGQIVISDGPALYEVTKGTSTSNNNSRSAKLLDTGNLILLEPTGRLQVSWQSFDNPTNVILPAMFLVIDQIEQYNQSFVSWTSEDDPAPGAFTLSVYFSVYADTTYWIIRQGSKIYWKRNIVSDLKNNHFKFNHSEILSSYGLESSFRDPRNVMRMVLDVFGQLTLQSWSQPDQRWHTIDSSKCADQRCGRFSVCNVSSMAEQPCSCLRGFKPLPGNNWTDEFSSFGCQRNTNLTCNNNNNSSGFYAMYFVDLPRDGVVLGTNDSMKCKPTCFNDCTCIAYSYDPEFGCLTWSKELFDLKQLAQNTSQGRDFYLKLSLSDLITSNPNSTNTILDRIKYTSNKMQVWIIVVLIVSLSILVLTILIHFVRRKFRPQGEDLLKFDLAMNLNMDEELLTESSSLPLQKKKEVKLPLFSFSSVSAATDNFSAANKLGEGGFGPVYKGVLMKGDEIAVKRLSKRSGQGWEELKNEALLIAKLQHKNLVRLLGCCIEKDEKILIYEYMPNKSLDFFLFERAKRRILDWETRVRIIEGIAQGLLYLHEYSRLRIIHRDLKASNILLDNNMNPKISDFGMARIFGGDELQANTNRIVGTYGYMSPEYALEGRFSIKSDVFSFGVLLLEIVSGKKNTGFYQSDSLHLLGHASAWDLWISNRGMVMELIDPVLEQVPTHLAMRYINIGLLCVQESADDRPATADVVSMLNNQSMILLSPKQPAFLNVRSMARSRPPSEESEQETYSLNNVTFSAFEAR